jgi:hypothetical protein
MTMATPSCVYNYEELRKVQTPPGPKGQVPPCVYIFVAGFPQGQLPHSGDTGMEGFFQWQAESNEKDDGGTIIKPNSLTNRDYGRWHRVFEGAISVKWFGARGDGKSVPDGVMQGNSTVLESKFARFTEHDVGKDIGVDGAGPVEDLITTILQVLQPALVRLAAPASTPVNNATVTVQDVQVVNSNQVECNPKTMSGGIMQNNSHSLNVPGGTFGPDDVELPIRVVGAGAAGPLYSQIASVANSTQVTLAVPANNAANGTTVFWGTDDTVAIQAAIDAADHRGGGIVFFPEGTYVIDGARLNADPNRAYGLAIKSNITYAGAGWSSILRLKDRSTANGADPQMFFAGPAGGSLSNVVFENLAFHGNSRHNLLGMACGVGGGALGDNRNCCAIWIGGLDYGQGVHLTGLTVRNCYFTDFPGANVIVVLDLRNPGGAFSSDVVITGNTFYDNRKADGNRDHSTMTLFADNIRVIGNRFALPFDATDLQKTIANACELHGSASCFNNNTLSYYSGGVIFSENLHHDCLCQEAVGNVMTNQGYRCFDVEISGKFKTVKQVNITGNEVHFGTVRGVTNQTLRPLRVPFPKWGVIFYIPAPTVMDSLNVTGNTFDGDALNQAGHVAGVAGIWGGGGYPGLTHLNTCGNTFRRLSYGVWQDSSLLTVAKHSTIVGNRFEDLANLTADPPNNPLWPPSRSARAVYMASHGGTNPIQSVSASGNSFVNEANESSYEYGFYFEGACLQPSVGENWYQIKKANLAFDTLNNATVVSLPPLTNRAVVNPVYGPVVTIDPGLGGRFMIVASDTNAFLISTPQISGSQSTFVGGTEIEIMIRNVSGGTLGDVSWGAGYKASWSNTTDKPAGAGGGSNITLRFRYDSASGLWLEVGKGSNAVPN